MFVLVMYDCVCRDSVVILSSSYKSDALPDTKKWFREWRFRSPNLQWKPDKRDQWDAPVWRLLQTSLKLGCLPFWIVLLSVRGPTTVGQWLMCLLFLQFTFLFSLFVCTVCLFFFFLRKIWSRSLLTKSMMSVQGTTPYMVCTCCHHSNGWLNTFKK